MRQSWLKRSFTCFAALLMLAQLVLTAGHIHLSLSNSQREGGVPEAAALPAGAGDIPSGPPRHDDDEDHCALCWAKAAASSLLIPPAIAPELPHRVASIQLTYLYRHAFGISENGAFRARAPPLKAIC